MPLPEVFVCGLQLDAAKKNVVEIVKNRYIMDLTESTTHKCFDKCTDVNSRTPLDRSESGCLALCCDRYLDSFNLVLRTLQNRGRS